MNPIIVSYRLKNCLFVIGVTGIFLSVLTSAISAIAYDCALLPYATIGLFASFAITFLSVFFTGRR